MKKNDEESIRVLGAIGIIAIFAGTLFADDGTIELFSSLIFGGAVLVMIAQIGDDYDEKNK